VVAAPKPRIQRRNNGRNHWYLIDGKKAPGVTTLIKGGLPKPKLVPWAAKSVAEYVADHLDEVEAMRPMGREAIAAALKQKPFTDRDKAAVRGTHVHDLASRLIAGEEVEVPDGLAGYVDSYIRFLDEWQPKPVLVETVVGHTQWMYCGTLDIVVDLPDGRRPIVDIKTSNSGIWPEVVLQTAGYRYAEFYVDADKTEKPMAALDIDSALALWVRSDGYDVYELPADESAFETFLHVATVARWAETARDLIGEACDVPDYSLTSWGNAA